MMPKVLAELREDGKLPIDFPMRKLAIYPNHDGQVVLVSSMDGEEARITIELDEVAKVCTAIKRASREAKPTAAQLHADYQTFLVIDKAKGGSSC